MSSTSAPIPAHRFAEAIKDLPLPNLHYKAAEIRNSIEHLESSNQQLQSFADDGDSDCKEAIEENVIVIQRMEQRIQLLKQEVEGRGYKWSDNEQKQDDIDMNGNGEASPARDLASPAATATEQGTRSIGGSISDEELARRLRERIGEDDDMDENGVHL